MLIFATLMLALAAVLASVIPARRAAGVEPMVALRTSNQCPGISNIEPATLSCKSPNHSTSGARWIDCWLRANHGQTRSERLRPHYFVYADNPPRPRTMAPRGVHWPVITN
jgi:hypothetical protein